MEGGSSPETGRPRRETRGGWRSTADSAASAIAGACRSRTSILSSATSARARTGSGSAARFRLPSPLRLVSVLAGVFGLSPLHSCGARGRFPGSGVSLVVNSPMPSPRGMRRESRTRCRCIDDVKTPFGPFASRGWDRGDGSGTAMIGARWTMEALFLSFANAPIVRGNSLKLHQTDLSYTRGAAIAWGIGSDREEDLRRSFGG